MADRKALRRNEGLSRRCKNLFCNFLEKADKYLKKNKLKSSLSFPGSIYFGQLKESKLADRQHKLEIYFNQLSSLISLVDYPPAIEFFEIDLTTKTLLSTFDNDSNSAPIKNEKEENFKRKDSDELLMSGSSLNMSSILELLTILNASSSSKVKSVKEYEEKYFNCHEALKESEIRKLLWGGSGLKGLLYFCGDFTAKVLSNACMNLFLKLITFEQNPEAEKVLAVFALTDPESIKQMHLEMHIKDIHTRNSTGIVPLYFYLKRNNHGICDPREVMNDEEAIKEYEKWMINKVANGNSDIFSILIGYLAKPGFRKASSKSSLVEAKSAEVRAEQIMREELLKAMTQSFSDNKIAESVITASVESSMAYFEELKDQLDDYESWTALSSGAPELRAYTKGDKMFRMTTIFKSNNTRKVCKLLLDMDMRTEWDRTLAFKKITQEVGGKDIVQLAYPITSIKSHKYCEYIVMREYKEDEESKSGMILQRSILLPDSSVSEIKRVHINAFLTTVVAKNAEISEDTEEEQKNGTIECQMLWNVAAGANLLAEMEMVHTGEMLELVKRMSKILILDD